MKQLENISCRRPVVGVASASAIHRRTGQMIALASIKQDTRMQEIHHSIREGIQ